MEKSQKLLTELRSRAAVLSDKRAAAEMALAEAIAQREKHMLTGDLADEQTAEKLQAGVDSWQSRLSGFSVTLDVLQAQIADTKQQITAERAAIERAAAADRLAQQIAAVEATLPKFMTAGGVLSDALSAISFHYETVEMARFLSNTMAQLEIAAGFSLAELRATVYRIKIGEAAIPREESKVEPVPMPEQPPPTQPVFMLRSAKYYDHDGRTRFAGQFEDATMPVPTAQRALRCGVAVPVTDPRRARLRGSRGSDFNPSASDVVDLDAVEAPKGAPYVGPVDDPVLAAANFQPFDRGSARTLKIAL